MATIVYKQDINLQRAIDDIVDLFKNNKLYSKKIADILTKHTKTLKFILNDFSDTPYISKNIWTEPVYINWDDGIVTEYKNFVDKDRLSEVEVKTNDDLVNLVIGCIIFVLQDYSFCRFDSHVKNEIKYKLMRAFDYLITKDENIFQQFRIEKLEEVKFEGCKNILCVVCIKRKNLYLRIEYAINHAFDQYCKVTNKSI